MYVDAYWFGFLSGVVLTVLVEVLFIILCAIRFERKKKENRNETTEKTYQRTEDSNNRRRS